MGSYYKIQFEADAGFSLLFRKQVIKDAKGFLEQPYRKSGDKDKMSEEKIFINTCDGTTLEALISRSPGAKAVVVTHPHPLYGGNMHNNVVEAVVRAYMAKGYTTLRFNFRGVDGSTGSHTGGPGEVEDLKAAFNYIKSMGKGYIALAGYSFGAWITSLCLRELSDIKHAVLISPPVSMIDFSFLGYDKRIKLVITGEYDDIAPEAILRELVPLWNKDAQLEVIKGTDHFYWGMTREMEDVIKDFLGGLEGAIQQAS